jgi:CRP-like cAMP-binding protein
LFHPVPREIKRYLLANFQLRKVRRGEFLLTPGEVCSAYYFIHQGALRAFIKEGEKEVTTWISCNNELATSIYSMREKRPSLEYIQAIKDSILLELASDKLEVLFQKIPESNVIVRKLITAYYQDAEIRSFIARMPSAESRCNFFLKAYPEKALIIPKKYIASFLGIREETLSRILKKRQ